MRYELGAINHSFQFKYSSTETPYLDTCITLNADASEGREDGRDEEQDDVLVRGEGLRRHNGRSAREEARHQSERHER